MCADNEGGYTCSCNVDGMVLFEADGQDGYVIPVSEKTDLDNPDSTYRLNHSCVRKYMDFA